MCSVFRRDEPVREFIYGVLIGAAVLYGWERFDVPGVWAWLSGATEYARQSTGGYGGTPRPTR
jgi:hypothetical protein